MLNVDIDSLENSAASSAVLASSDLALLKEKEIFDLLFVNIHTAATEADIRDK